MPQVKGSMLTEWVRTVRADRSGELAARLPPQLRAMLDTRVLPSLWYPFEFYKACFLIVFELRGGGDLRLARSWGLDYGQQILDRVYPATIRPGDPLAGLCAYERLFSSFFDFGSVQVEAVGEREVRLTVRDFDRDFEPFYHLLGGWMERVVQLCRGEQASVQFEQRSWDGATATGYLVRWST
ncbi:MAG: DUF2378 family protein [Pseudomonadota bacterium]